MARHPRQTIESIDDGEDGGKQCHRKSKSESTVVERRANVSVSDGESDRGWYTEGLK
jgi:hypothetical protein